MYPFAKHQLDHLSANCALFYNKFLLTGTDAQCLAGKGIVTIIAFVNALRSYEKEFYSLPEPIKQIQIKVEYIVPVAGPTCLFRCNLQTSFVRI